MTQFLISLFSLLTLTLLSFADQRAEENLRHLDLKSQVHFTIGQLTDQANFKKMQTPDELQVDADLARFKITRVSPAFISDDGRYVMTFARDNEAKIKRVIFVYSEGRPLTVADDVIDVKMGEIKTTKGNVSVAEGVLISN